MQCNPSTHVFLSDWRLHKSEPVARINRQQTHALTLVQSHADIQYVPQHINNHLPNCVGLDHFEGALSGPDRLNGAHQQHSNHHYGEYRDGISGHVHEK